MLLSQALVVLGAALTLATPVLHRDEPAAVEQDMVIREREAVEDSVEERGLGSINLSLPKAPLGALRTGWVKPGSPAFIAISLYHHNVHRLNHSAVPVTWNNTLFEWAQAKANTCVFSDGGVPDSVGINIAGGTYGIPKRLPNPSDMISGLWYNSELMNYPKYGVGNPNYNNFNSWGHFSQLVWPTSYQIGCGLAQCANGWFGACLYSPPGNWDGEFNEIGRPIGLPILFPNGQTHF